MKLFCGLRLSNLSINPLPQTLTCLFREALPRIDLVGIGPKLAVTSLSDEGTAILLTLPTPGAPGSVLSVRPPIKTDATVPNPVLHSISEVCAIWAASMLESDSPIVSFSATDKLRAPAPLVP